MHLSLPCRSLPLAVTLILGLAGATAQAQTAQELNNRALAATCANCHGTDGRPVGGSDSARLAGQSRDFLIEQLQAFRSGARSGTVMPQLAKGYSDAQIMALASYFASQP